MMGIIELSGIRLRRGRRQVLDDWNLTVESGEVVVLSGENGCGKSTLIEAAAGLLPLEAGSSTISGQLIRDHQGRRGRTNFGLCLQNDCIMGDELVEERLLDVAGHLFDVKSLLREWGLDHRANDRVAMLSGGQRRRIAVLSGLLPAMLSSKPVAVLLDEPDSGLDDASVERLAKLLRDLAAGGHSILVASHDERIKGVADRLISFPYEEEKVSQPVGEFSQIKFSSQRNSFIGLRMTVRTMVGFANNGIAGILVLGAMLALIDSSILEGNLKTAYILAPSLAAGLCGDPMFRLLQENRSHAWWRAMQAMPPSGLSAVFVGTTILTIFASASINHFDMTIIVAGGILGVFTAGCVGLLSHATLSLSRPNAVMIRLLTPLLILPWSLVVDRLSQ